jgi:predicted lipid-binding transport protein (Tim44 family)
VPAGFDTEGFLRQAKLNFIRLQAANDSGNLEDLKQFTAPEVFAEIQMQFEERGRTKQETDVMQLDAELLELTSEADRYVASVRFSGQIREEAGGPAQGFAEVWHLTKPASGGGWIIAGIQQIQ